MSITVKFREERKKWEVTYYLDGKRKRPLFDEEREAKNHARKISLGLSPEDKTSITIPDAGKRYFESESKRKSLKSQTNDRRYINLLYHFMLHERGVEKLTSIDLQDMEAFRDWLPTYTKMGPSSINRCLRVLKHFFRKNVQWANLTASPCIYLDFLESDEKPRQMMSEEQYLLALEKAPAWFIPALQFIRLTGAPGSCVERLEWSDVDLKAREFVMLRKKGKLAKWKRVRLPMSEQTFALFITLWNGTTHHEGSVFRDDRGQKLLSDRICKVGNRAIRDAGISGVTLYSLRHALASDLTNANVATELVRQAMGHSSISTTQRYANKGGLKSVQLALESVRGGSLVANE